jgi:hypothetical protein
MANKREVGNLISNGWDAKFIGSHISGNPDRARVTIDIRIAYSRGNQTSVIDHSYGACCQV